MPNLTPVTPLNLGQPPQESPLQIESSVHLDPDFVLETPPKEIPSQSETPQDPTKPWMNLDYKSQLPVVPVFLEPIFDSAAPCWGFQSAFNVGDLNTGVDVKSCPILNVTVNTLSAPVDMGVNRIDITVQISDFAASCTLNIYQLDSVNGNVLIKSYKGVTRFTPGLFVGGHDEIVLVGAKTLYEVTNITNGATVSVTIAGH